MMRMHSGILFALTTMVALAFSCADSSTEPDEMEDDPPASMNVCGDGVCAATEVGYCAQDCGSGGNNNNGAVCGDGMCETTKGENGSSCAADCGGGQGSGSGSGSGSSTSCPSDPFECFLCMLDPTFCMGGLTQATCQACIGTPPMP